MLHGRKQLLLDGGREDNPEAMLNVVDLLYEVGTHVICKCSFVFKWRIGYFMSVI